MKLVATHKRDQNDAAIDPWTAVHFGAGLAMGLVGVRFVPAMALAVGYELAEQLAERQEWGTTLFQTSGPESGVNAAVDVLVFGLGWYLARRYNAP